MGNKEDDVDGDDVSEDGVRGRVKKRSKKGSASLYATFTLLSRYATSM